MAAVVARPSVSSSGTTWAWVLRDATTQLENLIIRRAELDKKDEADRAARELASPSSTSFASGETKEGGAPVVPATPTSPTRGALNREDVKTGLRLLQQWIQKFATASDLTSLTAKLLSICSQLDPPNNEQKRAAGGKNAKGTKSPSSQDKQATIDEKSDNSVTFFVLTTLHHLFASIARLEPFYSKQDAFDVPDGKGNTSGLARSGGAAASPTSASSYSTTGSEPSLLSRTPEDVIIFAFERLHYGYSAAVRHAASQVLGVLSRHFLVAIAGLFSENMLKAKTETDQREFASYQSAIKFIDFGVAQVSVHPIGGKGQAAKQCRATMDYLTTMVGAMKKIDRGVLREQVCISLRSVFENILDGKDAQKRNEWDFFSRQPDVREFWELYTNIYNGVAKWSSKDKHRTFCFDLLWRMVTLHRSYEFYNNSSRLDIYTQLLAGLKKDTTRDKSMECLRDYLRELPLDFVMKDLESFTLKLRKLVAVLMPGKKDPGTKELQIMTETVASFARKHVHYLMNELAAEVLKPKASYSSLQKAVIFRALGIISQERRADAANYLFSLGPILAPFIEDIKERRDVKHPELLRAALVCFPHIRHSKIERAQITAAAVAQLTLHPDREISANSAVCMQEFGLLSPRDNLLQTIYHFLDMLFQVDSLKTEELMKTMNNLTFILTSVVEWAKKHRDEIRRGAIILPAEWVALREYMEATTLIWLCHSETFVRAQVIRTFRLFSSQELREFEYAVEGPLAAPFVADQLFEAAAMTRDARGLILEEESQSGSMDGTELFPELYINVLNGGDSNLFSGVLAYSWSHMQKGIETLLALPAEQLGSMTLDNEWFVSYKNRFRFVCLTIRSTSAPGVIVDEKNNGDARTARMSIAVAAAKQASKTETKSKPGDESYVPVPHPRLAGFTIGPNEMKGFFTTLYSILHLTETRSISVLLRALTPCIGDAHVSCHAELTASLRTPLTIEPTDTKRGTPKASALRNPVTEFWYHENTLDIFARLFNKMSPQVYHSASTVLTKTLDEYVGMWFRDRDFMNFRAMSLRGRRSVVVMIWRYLFFRTYTGTQHADHVSKADILSRRDDFFEYLRGVRSLAVRREDDGEASTQTDLEALERALLKGVAALIQLAPCNGQTALEDKFLTFLHHEPGRGKHLYEDTQAALHTFLKLNPERIRDFIARASGIAAEQKQQTSGRQSVVEAEDRRDFVHVDGAAKPPVHVFVASFFAKSVVSNWLESKEVKAAPATMLAFSLLHQCSPILDVRSAAMRLADALAAIDSPTMSLRVPYVTRLVTHKSPFVYIQSAIAYSTSLASLPINHGLIIPLLQEVTRLNGILSIQNKKIMLQLLQPWVAQCASFICSIPQVTDQQLAANAIFSSLLVMTDQCHESSLIADNVCDTWRALVTDDHLVTIIGPMIVDFLVARYGQPAGESPVQAICKMALTYLTRTRPTIAKVIVHSLIEHLRLYTDAIPTDAATFMTWQPDDDESQAYTQIYEKSAFELAINLVYECPVLFTPYISHMLQNACVMQSGQLGAGQMMVSLSLLLGIRQARHEARISDDTFINLVVAGSNGGSPHAIAAGVDTTSLTELRGVWTRLALTWAVNSTDERVSQLSLRLYEKLTRGAVDLTADATLVRLSFALYMAIAAKQNGKIAQIVNVLQLQSTNVPHTQASWTSLTLLGYSLLGFSTVDVFRHGLSLLNHTLGNSSTPIPLATRQSWSSQLTNALCRDEHTSLDQSIVDVTFKGLTNPDTCDSTLSVMLSLATIFADSVPLDNGLLILIMLAAIQNRTSELIEQLRDKSKAKAFATKDNEDPAVKAQINERRARGHRDIASLLATYAADSSNDERKDTIMHMSRLFAAIASSMESKAEGVSASTDLSNPRVLVRQFFAAFSAVFTDGTRKKTLPKARDLPPVIVAQRARPMMRQASVLVTPLFGGNVSDGIRRSKHGIPDIVVSCVSYLRAAGGLDVVGIFRVPGSEQSIQELKLQFEKGVDGITFKDANEAAGLLKLYFREMSEPLIPYSFYAAFLEAGDERNPDDRADKLRDVCANLPDDNRVVLNYLMHLLTLVAAKSSVNRMDMDNCAMVISPNILYKQGSRAASSAAEAQALVKEMDKCKLVIRSLIETYAHIFPEGVPRPGEALLTPVATSAAAGASGSGEEKRPVELATFDFVVTFFQRQLQYGATAWTKPLLLMMGNFLTMARANLANSQFTQLSELLTQSYYSSDAELSHLAENTAYVMVQRTDGNGLKDVFQFVRPRVRAPTVSKVTFLGHTRDDVELQRANCLVRLETHSFPLLASLRSDGAAPAVQASMRTRLLTRGVASILGSETKESVSYALPSDEEPMTPRGAGHGIRPSVYLTPAPGSGAPIAVAAPVVAAPSVVAVAPAIPAAAVVAVAAAAPPGGPVAPPPIPSSRPSMAPPLPSVRPVPLSVQISGVTPGETGGASTPSPAAQAPPLLPSTPPSISFKPTIIASLPTSPAGGNNNQVSPVLAAGAAGAPLMFIPASQPVSIATPLRSFYREGEVMPSPDASVDELKGQLDNNEASRLAEVEALDQVYSDETNRVKKELNAKNRETLMTLRAHDQGVASPAPAAAAAVPVMAVPFPDLGSVDSAAPVIASAPVVPSSPAPPVPPPPPSAPPPDDDVVEGEPSN